MIAQPARPSEHLIQLVKLDGASRQNMLLDQPSSIKHEQDPIDPEAEQKMQMMKMQDNEQCDNDIIYSSDTSEEYMRPSERQNSFAHPRHTANYLKLIKEKESVSNRTASASGSAIVHTETGKEESVKEIKLNIPKISTLMEPLPLLPYGKYKDSPTWRKKRVKQWIEPRAKSVGSDDSTKRKEKEKRKRVEQELEELQERLDRNADDIIVHSDLPVNTDKYPSLFKYKLYECFKPTTLKQTRNYIDFLTSNDGPIDPDELSPELQHYLVNKISTKLPSYIKEDKLLQFDANFESGNLDSVYLVNQYEYNLMLRVDTNTRGNTYWFNFKVLNWKPDTTITFNILNISRDLSTFFNNGMQILTKIENMDGSEGTEWVAGQHTVVEEFTQSEVARLIKGTSNEEGSKFNKLRFRVTFPSKRNFILKKPDQPIPGLLGQELELIPEGQESPCRDQSPEVRKIDEFPSPGQDSEKEIEGSVFCFAYAAPYTYGDLVCDLEQARGRLISMGGEIKNATKTEENGKNDKRQNSREPRSTPAGSTTNVSEFKSKTQRLSKFQLAQKEIMAKAINDVKGKLNRFETKLLTHQADLLHVKQRRQQCVEILTDYLHYKQEVISQSVGGLNLYLLTLTKRRSISTGNKKCIYITARLHAAETHGSWIMKYIISELTQNPEKHDNILNDYVIKLVPMMNPDGVTMGNARVSLVGLDLNRRWSDPNPTIHPEIYFIKQIMKEQAASQGIQIFCDMHGHNKKDNCFFYGCNKAADEGILSWTKTRLLPKIFAKVEEIFEYKSCRFKQDKQKLNTARVVVWNEMKVTNSFTLETSQYAKNLAVFDIYGNPQPAQRTQIELKDLQKIGQSFLTAVSQYNNLEKELEAEFKLNKGWFKPQKLKELTGEAARDKNARQNAQPITKKLTQKLSSSIGPMTKNKQQSSKNVTDEQTPKVPKKMSKQPFSEIRPLKRKNTQLLKNNESERKIGEEADTGSVKSQNMSKQSLQRHKTMGFEVKRADSKNASRSSSLQLRSWSDLFDAEEIRSGFNYMVKTKLAPPLETLDEESSDSAPSVDNFNAKELQECFKVVIDQETNPFEKDGVAEVSEPEPAVEEQEETKEIRAETPPQIQIPLESSSEDSPIRQQEPLVPQPRSFYDARVSNQFSISRVRNITNRIGYLAAQLQEIDRQRLNAAEPGQFSLMNLIMQQNQSYKSSAAPPSGQKQAQNPKSEAQTVISLNNRHDFVTPYLLQQQYRGMSLNNMPQQSSASQSNRTQNTNQENAQNVICTGTAKFKFNIYNGVPPIQIASGVNPPDILQGRSLQPVRSGFQQTQAMQPRPRNTANSAKKDPLGGKKSKANLRNGPETQFQTQSGLHMQSFFSNSFSPRDESNLHEPPVQMGEHQLTRGQMAATYQSPVIKPADKSFSPLAGYKQLQYETPKPFDQHARRGNLRSMEGLEKMVSPPNNLTLNDNSTAYFQGDNKSASMYTRPKNIGATHITGMLSHNSKPASMLTSPRTMNQSINSFEIDMNRIQQLSTFNRALANEAHIKKSGPETNPHANATRQNQSMVQGEPNFSVTSVVEEKTIPGQQLPLERRKLLIKNIGKQSETPKKRNGPE